MQGQLVTYVLFLLGFVALVKGASLLVDGAASIARRFNVSDFAIGMTVVAFGTSTPELFVTLFAALGGNPDIAIGNVVGSNIANTLLILGVTALIRPLAAMFLGRKHVLDRWEGGVLLAGYLAYLGAGIARLP